MAEQKINFTIGSTFSGEGFTKAQSAVQGTNKALNTAIGATNKIANAIGGMNNAAGQAANAVLGLTQAFAAGGAAGVAYQAAIVGCNLIVDQFKEKAEESTQALERWNQKIQDEINALDNLYSEMTLSRIDAFIEKTKGVTEQFIKQAESARKVKEEFLSMQESFSKVDNAMRESDRNEALRQAIDEFEKAVVNAQYDLEDAIEEGKQSMTKINNSIGKLEGEISDYKIAIRKSSDKILQLRNDYDELSQDLKKSGGISAERRAEINKRLAEIRDQLTSEQNLRSSLMQKQEIAEYKLTEARNEAEAQEIKNTDAEAQAAHDLEEAIRKQSEAALASAKKKQELAEKEEIAQLQAQTEQLSWTRWLADMREKVDRDIAEREAEWDKEFERRRQEGKDKDGNVANAWSNVDMTPVTDRLDQIIKGAPKSVKDIIAEQQKRAKELEPIKSDFVSVLRILDKAESWRSDAEKKFAYEFLNCVVPNLGKEEFLQMGEEIGNSNILIKDSTKDMVKNTKEMLDIWQKACGLK